MLASLQRNWWLVALRGVLAIIFGVLAFIWPGETVAVLVLFFGAYVLVDGVFALGSAIMGNTGGTPRWYLILEGAAGVIFGVLTFLWPDVTELALLYLIAAWGLVTGVFEILAAIEMRQVIKNEWLLVLSGIASILFGLLLVIFPGAGILSLIWLLASYAIVFGIVLVVLAFRLRGMMAAQQDLNNARA